MSVEEQRAFIAALHSDGWYGVFRTPHGVRCVPVTGWNLNECQYDPESGFTRVEPTFTFPADDQPLDVLGRYTLLGVYHGLYNPEPEQEEL